MNGQSIHHILANSKDEVMYSEKTMYKYVDAGLFDARNIDLRRKVRFRPRKSNHESLKIDRSCHLGRSYTDYQAFTLDNPKQHTVEIDTVYGKVGGKCLLTLHFVCAHFMLAYILNACTAAAVKSIFIHLRNLLDTVLYVKLFPVLLADRGSEFTDPKSIEVDEEGECVSRVYYCDPQQSQQKGSLETNHRFIRYFIPKGTSMDNFTQQHISLMMNHINSYGREELKDRSPYSMFEFLFNKDGKSALEKLGVKLIPSNEIILNPKLFKNI
jgi:IS30 family transposase